MEHEPVQRTGARAGRAACRATPSPARTSWRRCSPRASPGLLYLLLYRTRIGKAIRAVASNREAAELAGIPTTQVLALAFGLGVALAGVSGTLIATLFPFTVLSGEAYQLKSFVVTVLGGLGNPAGALLGGIALGLVEGLATPFMPVSWIPDRRVRAVRDLPDRASRAAFSRFREPDAVWRRPFPWLIVASRRCCSRSCRISPTTCELRESLLLAAVYIILASNLNLMIGYAGYVNFGNIVFFGLGGYVCLYLVND